VRQIRFTDVVEAAILSNHRRIAPFGLDGGASGATGRNSILRADGSDESLPGTATVLLQNGDTVIIETPGGGGFGARE